MKDGTYKEWLQRGYFVRKGETATGKRPDGTPTFKREQVDDKYDPRKRERDDE